MKKPIVIAIAIFAGFLSLLWLEKLLRSFLINQQLEAFDARYYSGLLVWLFLLAAALLTLFKLKLNQFAGLSAGIRVKNLHAAIVPKNIIADSKGCALPAGL